MCLPLNAGFSHSFPLRFIGVVYLCLTEKGIVHSFFPELYCFSYNLFISKERPRFLQGARYDCKA